MCLSSVEGGVVVVVIVVVVLIALLHQLMNVGSNWYQLMLIAWVCLLDSLVAIAAVKLAFCIAAAARINLVIATGRPTYSKPAYHNLTSKFHKVLKLTAGSLRIRSRMSGKSVNDIRMSSSTCRAALDGSIRSTNHCNHNPPNKTDPCRKQP
eukprot:TRINITY_DN2710_c1_g1_i3.p1 TRINITY_DN2710_c1_g1~~TRINITY_DN2710_c1_g1_i3.p1  ORF type:complete len:152 (-),score=17.84 TRINITY_DN2710_c1_g1_i3:124-579(-)